MTASQTEARKSFNVVVWKKNGLRLLVLGTLEGRLGERRYSVCKETATWPNPGRFSVRVDDVEATFQ